MRYEDELLEQFLYKVVEEVSKLDAPIVFKGGLILKKQLEEVEKENETERKTVDIDANWVNIYDEEQILNIFQTAVKEINPQYDIYKFRDADEHKSMGLKILNEDKIVISKIDLDIRDNPFYVMCSINDVDVKCSSIPKIMADKISVLSGEHIFRRTKDLYDMFLLIQEEDIDLNDVKYILNYEHKELGDFSTMLNNKSLVEDSYNKLSGINNKPSFDKVWDSVIEYLDKNYFIDESKDVSSDDDYEM